MNQSIRKAFEILAFVVENPRRMSLNEMSSQLGMNRTTLFRFLSTLESLEFLSKKDDYFVPGIKLFELGSKVPVKKLIVDKVHPILLKLTAETNETVNMAEFNKNQVLYLDKTESQRSLQIQSSVGSYISLHATALGKSILSILPEELREAVIGQLKFVGKTSKTIADAEVLRSHILQVGERGYSTDCEEMEEGLHCVAVPLLIQPLNFYGGISCSGPTVRFTHERMAELAVKLRQGAEEIKELFQA